MTILSIRAIWSPLQRRALSEIKGSAKPLSDCRRCAVLSVPSGLADKGEAPQKKGPRAGGPDRAGWFIRRYDATDQETERSPSAELPC